MRASVFLGVVALAAMGCGGIRGREDAGTRPDLGGGSVDFAPPNPSCVGAGTICDLDNPCAPEGVIECDQGAPTCVSSGPLADGTSCGYDEYCVGGACVTCIADQNCAPTPCTTGVTDCSTGTSICTPTGNLDDGSYCGAGQVCSGGACVACAAGTSCPSARACQTATVACDTGSPVCVESGYVANGTTCGTNEVCQIGDCVPCVDGGSCQPPGDPCATGTLSCATGSSVCTATSGTQPDGTGCGMSYFCKAGACTLCSAGASCHAPDACKSGVTVCSDGNSSCADGPNLADGTSCGTNQVCSGGACGACTAGIACTPANPCHSGITDCSTGKLVCKDTSTNLSNGTGCGTNAYCYSGACTTCVGGGACTPSDPCQTGTYVCASGLKTCEPSGASSATSCGVTTVGACVAGACHCPTGTGFWNGDCASCPAFAVSAEFLVSGDPTTGVDNQCCGRVAAAGFGGPCLTVTQALKNIAEESPWEPTIMLSGDALGNASPRESYPITLPAGVTLQASANTCLPGVAGKDVLHFSTTSTNTVINVNTQYSANPSQLTLGMTCGGVASGATIGMYVGSPAVVYAGNIVIAKTTTGLQINGGEVRADAGNLTINDVSGDGVFCQALTGSSTFEALGGGGLLITARVAGRALYASTGCSYVGPVALGAAPCPSPKLDGQGIVADGTASVSAYGTIQCMQGNGIALMTNAALPSNAPSVGFSAAQSPYGAAPVPGVLQHNGCAGAYAEVGTLGLNGVHILHNHWGVHQKTSSVNATITVAQASAIDYAPTDSLFACNSETEPGTCCTAKSCTAGADVFNESGAKVSAENTGWQKSPVTVCNCNAALQSCACSTGGATPPDGINILDSGGGSVDATSSVLITPAIACN